ncbi:MAG TPA: ABC transporter substrate-binding protein [Balneolaceae bacterium]|nr:ABC transporter substrate-binding protein [Balneolaceae bacterium]
MDFFKGYRFRFSRLLFTIFLFTPLLLPIASRAQSFEDGLNLYQQGNYSDALTIFTKIDTDKARLFAGKSYFALGKYLTADAYLNNVSKNSSQDIYLEAQYTLALSDFQLGQYGDALNRLYPLQRQEVRTQVITNGIQLYRDILNYLTLNQRRSAFQQAKYPEIKYDLVSSAMGRVAYPVAKTLYKQLLNAKIDTTTAQMHKLTSTLSDSMKYAVQIAYNNRLIAPKGITYNLGAALPSYSNNDPNYEVSQGLYFGYTLAAEQFNQQHPNKKAFIRYQNTNAKMDSSAYAMTDLAWNSNVDVVLGPLYSDPASSMAKLAEEYQIPMIAPLANSDSLNIDNPYVYQANPTFASHGKKMAEYAVKDLHMDTLAVLVGKNMLGEASAYAFREKAEKLGAHISYFFVEDFKKNGYDLSDFTKYFTTDSVKIDTMGYHHLDGVYAPFTGQASKNLANLLLVDLEAMGSKLPVLGSQEWGKIDIPTNRIDNRNIYFSESFYTDKHSQKVEQFDKEYKQRFDIEPNRFAMIGYDVASYVMQTLDRVANPALLKDALKNQPMYQGLISNIDFEGTHINQEVKIFKLSEDGVQPVRQTQYLQ